MNFPKFSRVWLAVAATILFLVGFGASPASAQLSNGQEYSANADASWQVVNIQPSATVDFESLVWDFAEVNGRMFVAGRFGGVRQNNNGAVTNQSFLAAFDLSTGNWISSFRPVLNGPAFALDVTPDGSRLLVGGEFTQVNGTNTGSFVALNPNTGALASGFQANVTFTAGTTVIQDIEVASDGIYIGGNFNRITNASGTTVTRNRLAKLNPNNGSVIGAFNASVQGARVLSIDVDADRVYLGGYFSSVNSAANTRLFATVRSSNGSLFPGVRQGEFVDMPNFSGGTIPFDIDHFGDKVYLATEAHNLIILNRSDLSRIGFFHTQIGGGDYQALDVSGGRLYAGGHYWATQNYDTASYPGGIGGVTYRETVHRVSPNLTPTVWASAYDAATGAHQPSFLMDISAQSGVWAIKRASNGTLWVGGDLTRAGNRAVGGFAKFSPAAHTLLGANLAPGGTASQSSVNSGLGADLGNDRLLTGRNVDLYLSTNNQANPWWQVDLGSVRDIGAIRVWKPATCCGGAINGAKVFVSNSPFTSTNPTVTEGQAGVSTYNIGSANRRADLSIQRAGRYVRVQLPRTAALVLDEVEVLESTGIVGGNPVAPASCSVVNDGGGVRVSWVRAGSDNAESFVVRRRRGNGSFFWAARVNAPGVTWTDSNVAAGASYTYTVETVGGGSRSATTTCAPSPIVVNGGAGNTPVAPASCSVVNAGGGVRVDWVRAGSDNAESFVVRRQRGNGSFFWAARVNAPGVTWTDSNVAVGASYTYTVETVGGGSRSATTTCSPAPIVVNGGGGGQALKPAACSVTLVNGNVRVNWTPAAGDAADRYVVRRARNNFTNFFWAAAVNAPTTTWTDSNVIRGQGQRYTYQVVARLGNQSSDPKWCSPVPIIP